MQVFDSSDARRRLDGDLGLRRSLARSYEENASANVLGHIAECDIDTAIECFLVGYDQPAELLLIRAREWLKLAIKKGEKPHDYVQNSTEANRHFNLAMCNWLLLDAEDEENAQAYLAYLEPCLDKVRPSPFLPYSMPPLMSVGAYRRALDLFALSRVKPAASLDRIITEGQMAYVLCRHVLGEQYVSAEVGAALKRFLDRAVNYWLLDGHILTTAMWMKIAHFNGHAGELTARDTLLKCFDYLKDPIPAGPGNVP